MSHPKGYILLVVMVLMTALLTYSMALIKTTISAAQTERKIDFKSITSNIAEAGIEKAIWCLNQTSGTNCGGTCGSGYAGETNVAFGGGIFDITMTAIDGATKQIEAAAYYPNKAAPVSKTIIRTRAATNTDKASFFYGSQVGAGGMDLRENVTVNGNVYSNGDIEGEHGAKITGDAYVAGGTALTADRQCETYNADFVFGKTDPKIDLAQSFIPGASDVLNKISLYIKRTNWPYNLTIKIRNDDDGAPGDATLASATLYTSAVSTSYNWADVSFSSPPHLQNGTKYWLVLDASKSSSNYWTIGVDALDNCEGTMLYSESWYYDPWNASGKDINFKTWLGGIQTKIEDVTVQGNAYAHLLDDVTVGGNAYATLINNSTIGKDAIASSTTFSTIGFNASSTSISHSVVGHNLWCGTSSYTTVGWTKYCPTAITPPADPGPLDYPISTAMINDWKADAEAGGVIEGNYTVSASQSLGPKKINGNLTISNSKILTVTGTIYVTGKITINNNASIVLDGSYGSASGIVMSDDVIDIQNGAIFSGAGAGSYVMLVSLKNDTVDTVIDVNNNATAALLYAPYGIIDIDSNVTIKQATAYGLNIDNNAAFSYEMGLTNVLFSTGPSGGWGELKGWWQIVE